MVERFGNKYFGGATYNFKCPFDIAMKIKDECEHRGKDVTWVRDILNQEIPENAYTKFGKEIVKAFNLLTNYGFSTNKGVAQEDIDFQIRYYDYLAKNDLDFKRVRNSLFESYCNNKDARDFSKFNDLETFDNRCKELTDDKIKSDAEFNYLKAKRKYEEVIKNVKHKDIK